MLAFLAHFTYLGHQAYFIGLAVTIEWGLHFRRLWRRRWRILVAVAVITLYGGALDAWAVSQGWGWFNPRLITNVWFGSLLLGDGSDGITPGSQRAASYRDACPRYFYE